MQRGKWDKERAKSTQHLPGLGGSHEPQGAEPKSSSGLRWVMTLEMLLCPTCASVSRAEGTSTQHTGYSLGGYCSHPSPQLAPCPVTKKARRGSSGDPASITATPVLSQCSIPPCPTPAQPCTDLERVLPADVVRGLHGRHAEAEEGDAAQDALLLLIWCAKAGVTCTEGLGAPAAPQQRPPSCCGDTWGHGPIVPSRGRAAHLWEALACLLLPGSSVQLRWACTTACSIIHAHPHCLPGLSPWSCQGGWGRRLH